MSLSTALFESLSPVVAAGPPDQSSADSFFGETGLLIFVSMFAVVLIYTFARRNQTTFDHARHMPLDDRSLEESVDERGNLKPNQPTGRA